MPYVDDQDFRKNIQLSVIHRDGSEDVIADGGVVFIPGGNVNFEVAEDSEEITINVNSGTGTEDQYFRQKFNSILSLDESNNAGNPIVGPFFDPDIGAIPVGPAWTFTNKSVWLVKINNTTGEGETNTIFLNSSSCTNIGQFVTNDGYPEILQSELGVSDLCAPCTDCDIYDRLYEYIDRIGNFLDYHLELIMNIDTEVIPTDPDGNTDNIVNGIYHQILAAQRFWDSQVHVASVKCASQGQGAAIVSAFYYTNISTDTIGDSGGNGITVTFRYDFFRNGVAWDAMSVASIDPRLLFRTGADDPPDRIRGYTLSAVYTINSIIVTTTTVDDSFPGPRLLPSGGILYVDIALLLKDFTLFDDGANYTVNVTTTIDLTHLKTPTNQDGTTTCEEVIYMVPTEEEPSST